ncbi:MULTISPECIES: LysE family translocator [Kitasatospora]|uniref:LysE family translocator n=1 Tax=Kitasatospora TaxID=2063 RepID=UPI000C70B31B|nr:LysE family translocator [Kitasatospora sp. GP30]MDH6142422.1 threonine/homoserine/homoserine lactone efflux protein [Kitasatospora sp. GP30]
MDALTSAVDPHAMLGVAAMALGMVLTPGPNMIYLVSRSIAQGRRAGLLSLAGVATAFLAYLTAVTAGVATVFAVVPLLYTVIKLAGAAYLLWLAWQAVRPGGAAVFAPKQLPPDPPRKLFAMGFLTCLLNPKMAIMYISLLPQFITPSRGHVAAQSFVLGLTQIAVAVTVNGLIALGAGGIAAFLDRRPAWLRIQRYAMGTVLGALALHIAADRAKAVTA